MRKSTNTLIQIARAFWRVLSTLKSFSTKIKEANDWSQDKSVMNDILFNYRENLKSIRLFVQYYQIQNKNKIQPGNGNIP